MNHVPSLTELEALSEQSWQANNRVMVLPFQCGQPPQTYTIAMVVPAEPFGAHPRWAFSRELQNEIKTEWVYESADVALIHNMLLCEFADEVLTPAVHSSYAYQQASTYGSPETPGKVEFGREAADDTTATKTGASIPAATRSEETKPETAGLQEATTTHSGETAPKQETRKPPATEALFAGSDTCKPQACEPQVLEQQALGFQIHAPMTGTPQPPTIGTPGSKTGKSEPAKLDPAWAKYLSDRQIDEDSYLAVNAMSYEEYVDRTKEAIAIDEDLQRRFAGYLNERTRIGQAARMLGLSSVDWMPLVYNMLNCGLVRQHRQREKEAVGEDYLQLIDKQAISNLEKQLISAATGFYSSAAFVHFLSAEFQRYQTHKRPFSVVLMRVKRKGSTQIDVRALAIRMARTRKLMQATDYLCHFENFGFALLLPEVQEAQAKEIVKKLAVLLPDQEQDALDVLIKIGSAQAGYLYESRLCSSPEELLQTAMSKANSVVITL